MAKSGVKEEKEERGGRRRERGWGDGSDASTVCNEGKG